MVKLLIDTCVWLDIAKTSKGEEILNLLSEFIDNKEIEILLPEIIISEFDRNKDRVIADAGKSLSSQFKKVKEMVAEHADEDSKQKITTANSGLAKWRVTCFYDTFVVKQTVVLLMNFSAKNPPLRQAAKR